MISAGFGPPYASAITRRRRMASRGALTRGRAYVNERAHYDLAACDPVMLWRQSATDLPPLIHW